MDFKRILIDSTEIHRHTSSRLNCWPAPVIELSVNRGSFSPDWQAAYNLKVLQSTGMTITLNLKPEVEAGLLAQAQANGMTLEKYLLSMVEGVALSTTQKSLSPEQRATAFETWAAGHRSTPDLSDHAVTRESMYEGRDH